MKSETKIKMSGSGCLEFKIHYSEMNDLAIGDDVLSEEFSVGGHLWQIICYPHGDLKADMGKYVSLYLQLITDSMAVTVKTIFQVFVLQRRGSPSFSDEQKFIKVFSSDEDGDDGQTLVWGWNQFLQRSLLETLYLCNGWVTFLCNLIVLDAGTIAVPPSNMGRDLSLLLDSKAGADVSFVLKGETIQAHRAILAARSPVFRVELFGSMADATSPFITVKGIAPATFKAMIGFIYTDELPEDDEFEMMQNLLAAADRYALDRLKLICARKLWDNISEDRFAPLLVCADTYKCPELKSKCIDFFAADKNLRKIIFTDGFQWLVRDFPLLAAELKKRVGMQHS